MMTKKEKQVQKLLENFKNEAMRDKNYPKDSGVIQVGKLLAMGCSKRLAENLKKLGVDQKWLYQHNFVIAAIVLKNLF